MSSRYCSSFIIASLCIPLLTLKHISGSQKSKLFDQFFLLLFAFLTIFNLFLIFHPFRDIYIYDLKDEICLFLSEDKQSFVLIQGNEYGRLKNNDKEVSFRQQGIDWIISDNTINELLDQFSYWNGKVYVVFSQKIKNGFLSGNFRTHYNAKIIGHYYSNKKKNSFNSVILYEPSGTKERVDSIDQSINFIKNGDIETVQSAATTRHKLRKIISEGALFYQQDSTQLPVFDTLLPLWKEYRANCFPKVFADTQNAISGSNSLHIFFPKDNIAGGDVYFLNSIQKMSGRLSFKIQNISNPGVISILVRESTSDNRILSPIHTYHYNLFDQLIHTVHIDIQEETINTDRFIFSINGNDMEVLIDDIIFYQDVRL